MIPVTIGKASTEQPVSPGRRPKLRLAALVGSGDRIGAFVLPFVLVGVALYVGSRLFAPAEEADLAARFGRDWDAYRRRVKVPWL